MKKNRLGKSDLYVSALTLGCMSLGTNLNQATKIIDSAIDAGINHLDTADLYDLGANEEIVGAAIKHKRAEVILTTKVGNHFNRETGDWFWDPSPEHIEQGLKDSLHRLKTDYIDFYMLHGGTLDDPMDESIAAFEKLKKEGLIRAYGISSIRPNVIHEYIKRSNIDAVMMQYNLLDRRPEEEILDLLNENSISVLARGPLAKGMLSNQAEQLIQTKGKNGFLDYTFEELQAIEENISKEITEKYPFPQLAFKYVLKHPSVASAVFGASTIDQVKINTGFDYSEVLPTDLYIALQNYTKAITYTQHRS